jgi:hypothetical protein
MARSKLEKKVEERFEQEASVPPWETEYKFTSPRGPAGKGKPRKWRFDFSWPALKIAVEVEGGTWVKGAHSRGKRYASDCAKYGAAALSGWILLRWTTDAIRDRWEYCMAELEEALLIRKEDAVSLQ